MEDKTQNNSSETMARIKRNHENAAPHLVARQTWKDTAFLLSYIAELEAEIARGAWPLSSNDDELARGHALINQKLRALDTPTRRTRLVVHRFIGNLPPMDLSDEAST
jgi:hypothetical protein